MPVNVAQNVIRVLPNTKRGGYMDKKELKWSEKVDLYHKQQYKIPAPPVPTMFWETADWIRFIDVNGEWIV